MTAVTYVLVQAQIVQAMKDSGIIDANDNIQTRSVADWEAFAPKVIDIFAKNGITLPPQVSQVVAALPLLLAAFGLK